MFDMQASCQPRMGGALPATPHDNVGLQDHRHVLKADFGQYPEYFTTPRGGSGIRWVSTVPKVWLSC
ncbi:hypothetical protein HEK616_30850 [Streptomyces nigrescens]|uniref:Uncharacterized protein n=1 Tax=Streptomyces nigrescens TaxID=1920 RepID=A0ABN6QTV3_STRNI|nr:hypothetical protein HEK616_30850 [Streptomyces nigrescens]